ncbi:glycine-rich domain-containing protein [Achromobacter aegrifaciens]
MQASNAPIKSAVPFANSGTKNAIPVASQIGVTPGLASFADGFPPLTMTPLAAGGVPPYGADFNGILNFLSAAVRWEQAGSGYSYDAAFSTAIGGYPKGAVLRQAAANGYWLNLADNNTTDPDAGGANWVRLPAGVASTAQAQALMDDTTAVTPLKLGQALAAVTGYEAYTSPGVYTFDKPAGTSKVYVRVYGAGGGGACDVAAAPGPGGGGQGGYWEGLFDISAVSSVIVTVGTGGAGGPSIGTNGTVGGASSFGTYCSCGGGAGGLRIASSSAGGTATGTAGFGWRGGYGNGPQYGSGTAPLYGGAGGGGWSPFASSDSSRVAAPGMGGGGRIATAGAAGAHGAVLIQW